MTTVKLNDQLSNSIDDVMYHFGLSKIMDDLSAMFQQIKFICVGGSSKRLHEYAKLFAEKANVELSENLSKSDRYSMWTTGPVLWANHGIGTPSCLIVLNEVFKILKHAGARDFKCIRVGTSGGVGVKPGTVVVSSGAVDNQLQQKFVQHVGENMVERDAFLDGRLADELFQTATKLGLLVDTGLTLCSDDFYEGQMRLDGFFSDHTAEEKHKFLVRIKEKGVKNIEMESVGFAAFTHRANVPGAIVCVALLDRFEGDQIKLDKDTYRSFEMRPFEVVSTYILERMRLGKNSK